MLTNSIDVTEGRTPPLPATPIGAPLQRHVARRLIDAERWATGAAALAVQTAGAQASVPTLADAEATFGTPVPR